MGTCPAQQHSSAEHVQGAFTPSHTGIQAHLKIYFYLADITVSLPVKRNSIFTQIFMQNVHLVAKLSTAYLGYKKDKKLKQNYKEKIDVGDYDKTLGTFLTTLYTSKTNKQTNK